jgi:pyruvate/2-oxoglutarate dehydrogenase complex dihydrolipoamide dehydrogenase (E3) component
MHKPEVVDVIVIGMGPGGEDVAERLAQAGLSVVGIEGNLVGGECPYWGCVPSKMMIRAANALAEGRRIAELAGTSTVTPDWAPVARRVRDEATDNWDDIVAVERFEKHGGRFVRGWGRLSAPQRVSVDGHEFEATKGIVLATGASSSTPPIPGLAGLPYWTNREAIELERLPRSLAIIGGGAIAVELGQVFNRFGTSVTIIEAAPRLLPVEDPMAGELLERVFDAEGIDVWTGMHIQRVSDDGSTFRIDLNGGAFVGVDQLLVAAGRRPDLTNLGVDVLGLDPKASQLETDNRMRVADGVWAVGDVTAHGAFTHVAMYQANIAVHDILGQRVALAAYNAVPRVTFTDPEIGSVGLSEDEAHAAGLDVRVGIAPIPSSARGWIHKTGNDGFIKLIEDARRGVLVGAVSAGPTGGEVLGLLTLAVHAQVPTASLRSMIYAYPTFHRAVEAALAELG